MTRIALVTGVFLLTSCAIPSRPQAQASPRADAPLSTGELIGSWMSPGNLTLTFVADGRYYDDGIDDIMSGRWRLRGNVITMFVDIPAERQRSPRDNADATIIRIERQPDRVIISLRYSSGKREIWTKT